MVDGVLGVICGDNDEPPAVPAEFDEHHILALLLRNLRHCLIRRVPPRWPLIDATCSEARFGCPSSRCLPSLDMLRSEEILWLG